MTIDTGHRLEDLIADATQRISAAVTVMGHINREIVELLEIRAQRPWASDEFARYLDLSRRERAAHRQYVAGLRWFDEARIFRTNQTARARPEIDGAGGA